MILLRSGFMCLGMVGLLAFAGCQGVEQFDQAAVGESLVATCGDGFVTVGEECDDDNLMDGDGCDSQCTIEAGYACTNSPSKCSGNCGNGESRGDTIEQCDDGNNITGDGCDEHCRVEDGYTCIDDKPSVCTNTDCVRWVQWPYYVEIKEPGEECDDGNPVGGDGCSETCTVEVPYACTGTPSLCSPTCGDGYFDRQEECDDGNLIDGDGCANTCTIETGFTCTGEPSTCTNATCGNGLVNTPGEECDDGNTVGGDGCDNRCSVELLIGPLAVACTNSPSFCRHTCGNGTVDVTEECDDGNTITGDGCDENCTVERGFTCTGDPSTCTNTTCGDGFVDAPGEECDDGNLAWAPDDGCDLACQLYPGFACSSSPSLCTETCGDGNIDPTEQCDDGNIFSSDGCNNHCAIEQSYSCIGEPSTCTNTTCGDGLVNDPGEECDDGNTAGRDGCDATCQMEPGYACASSPSICTETCGDGVLDPTEECDDNNSTTNDGCDSNCRVEPGYSCTHRPGYSICISGSCGDGIVSTSEECDDGDTDGGDGCDNQCQVETGFACSGAPSLCTSTCGDGVLDATEECDDGNIIGGDGCNSHCRVQAGYSCTGAPSTCTNATCGDGTINAPGEQCDDGNTEGGDACDNQCQVEAYTCANSPSLCPQECGNGVVEPWERCDDGNITNGDGCDSACLLETGWYCVQDTTPADGVCDTSGTGSVMAMCGDAIVIGAAGEICDDGNTNTGDGCDDNCALEEGWGCALDLFPADGICDTGGRFSVVPIICGDSRIIGPEECDDGNNDAGDGCDENCELETGWECRKDDNPADGICDRGGAGSVVPICGDSVIVGSEICDDGNNDSGDGCDATCATVETGYVCTVDAGSDGTCDTGGAGSVMTVCGDSIIAGAEICDDGNATAGDGCSATCTVETGYACTQDTTPADGTCDTTGVGSVVNICGDAIIVGPEICDDGNNDSGDGCSETCDLEPGYECMQDTDPADGVCDTAGPGSVVLSPVCGNGIVEAGEVCDDGDETGGDGCSSTCQLEEGYVCAQDSMPMDGICDTGGPGSVVDPAGGGVVIGGGN